MKYLQSILSTWMHISMYYHESYIRCELWPLSELFGLWEKNLVYTFSWKSLKLHAWKFIYDKTIINWRHWAFVLGVEWSVRELLALKLYSFYIKIYNSQTISAKDMKPTGMWSVPFDLENRSRSKVKVIVFPLKISMILWERMSTKI